MGWLGVKGVLVILKTAECIDLAGDFLERRLSGLCPAGTHISYSSIHFNLMRLESKHSLPCQAELDCNPSSSKEVCVFILGVFIKV